MYFISEGLYFLEAQLFTNHSAEIYYLVGQVIVNPAPVITCRHKTHCVRPVVKKYFLTPKGERLRLTTKYQCSKQPLAVMVQCNVL